MTDAIGTLNQLDPSLKENRTVGEQSSSDINKQEFMTLLVTQLKNQDPLNPMENEEFAVQLAQFTQVEELVKANEKLEALALGGGNGGLSSFASYLGNEVWLNSDQVEVNGGKGGEVAFDLATDASEVTIQLINEAGAVQEEVNLGALGKGAHRVPLEDLSLSGGTYTAKAVASTGFGTTFETEVSVAGVVSGFMPGENPTLLLGDREVSAADIKRVQVAA